MKIPSSKRNLLSDKADPNGSRDGSEIQVGSKPDGNLDFDTGSE